jgi:hypothetical protein
MESSDIGTHANIYAIGIYILVYSYIYTPHVDVPSYHKVTNGQGTEGPSTLVLVGTTAGTEVMPVVGLGYEGPLR